MKTLILLIVVLCISAAICTANTIYIPSDQPTIQAGIDAALESDTVLVAPGTYTGDGNRDLNFQGKNIVLMSEGGRDVTIVDCQATTTDRHRGFYFGNGETEAAVIQGFTFTGGYETVGAGGLCDDATSPTIKDCGFVGNTAEGIVAYDSPGFAETKDFGRGGGVNCNVSRAQFSGCLFSGNVAISGYQIVNPGDTPEVLPGLGGGVRAGGVPVAFSNCLFENNTAEQGGAIFLRRSNSPLLDNVFINNSADLGGAVHCARSNPNTRRNEFTDNSAGSGGAMYFLNGASPTIRENTITSCTATENGGGIFCDHITPTVSNNRFSENQAGGRGGGIYCTGAGASLTGNTFVANQANVGGGIWCDVGGAIENNTIVNNLAVANGSGLALSGSTFTVDNCIVADNQGARAVACIGGGEVALFNCDLYGNAGGDWSGCIADQVDINNNISVDAMFCDPEGGDCHLSLLSPCAPGNNRSQTLIGAFEAACGTFVCGDVDLDGELTAADVEALAQVYYSAVRPAFYPTPVADMNCDGIIDIGDLIRLADFLYGRGPAPCCAPPLKSQDRLLRDEDAGLPGPR